MNDAFERRALLLHLGAALQTLSHILEYERGDETIGELIATQQLLADVPFVEYVFERMTVREFGANVLHAFCLWPQLLLDDPLDRDALALSVRHHLFDGNPRGWEAYLRTLREDVPWFGEGLESESPSASSDETGIETT